MEVADGLERLLERHLDVYGQLVEVAVVLDHELTEHVRDEHEVAAVRALGHHELLEHVAEFDVDHRRRRWLLVDVM